MATRQNANTMHAIVDMAHALSGSFEKYSISTRQKAWKSLSSARGDKEVAKLIRNPNRPINTFQRLAFREWFSLNEGLQIIHIDPEEDWEYGEQLIQIANLVKIRPDSTKEATIVALNDKEEVIGGVFTSWSDDHDATEMMGRPISVWDFDVVVHPKWQGYEMVGMKLIKQAEDERQNLESMYGQDAYTKLWVVNPRLAQILQRKHGYDAHAEYPDGSAHLVKY